MAGVYIRYGSVVQVYVADELLDFEYTPAISFPGGLRVALTGYFKHKKYFSSFVSYIVAAIQLNKFTQFTYLMPW